MENKTSTNHENGNDANRLLADVWQTSDRPFKDYPVGTKAQAQGGGYWIKNERGWKWCTGATFPAPGGDWNGMVSLPNCNVSVLVDASLHATIISAGIYKHLL